MMQQRQDETFARHQSTQTCKLKTDTTHTVQFSQDSCDVQQRNDWLQAGKTCMQHFILALNSRFSCFVTHLTCLTGFSLRLIKYNAITNRAVQIRWRLCCSFCISSCSQSLTLTNPSCVLNFERGVCFSKKQIQLSIWWIWRSRWGRWRRRKGSRSGRWWGWRRGRRWGGGRRWIVRVDGYPRRSRSRIGGCRRRHRGGGCIRYHGTLWRNVRVSRLSRRD